MTRPDVTVLMGSYIFSVHFRTWKYNPVKRKGKIIWVFLKTVKYNFPILKQRVISAEEHHEENFLLAVLPLNCVDVT